MAQENIDVTVTLANALSAPAGRAEESIEDLRDEVRGLNRDLAAAQAQMAANERAMAALRAQTRRTSTETKRSRRDTDDASQAMSRFDRVMGRVNTTLGALGKSLGLLKFGAILSVLPLLITLVAQLGLGAVALVAALAPLVGLFGALPGVVGAFALAMTSVKLGMSGIGDATKALMDSGSSPADVAEAMNKLTDSGRRLARTVSQFSRGPLQEMKDASQNALAPGFTAALRIAGDKLMPMLTRRVAAAATVMGSLGTQAAATFGQPFFRGQLNTLLKSSVDALDGGGRAALAMATAGVAIGAAFSPVLNDIVAGAVRAADALAMDVQLGSASGELTAFFERAWDLAKNLWGGLKDIGGILYDVGSAAQSAGGALGSSIGGALDKFRDFVGSVEGQTKLKEWFADALPTIEALGGLIVSLAGSLGSIAASSSEVTGSIRGISDALPNIADLLGGVAQSVSAVTNQLVSNINDMLVAWTPGVTAIVNDVTADLIPALEGIIGPASEAGAAFLSVIGHLAPLVGVLQPLGAILQPIASFLTAVADGLNLLPSAASTAVVSVGALIVLLRFFSGTKLATGITSFASGIQRVGFQAAAAATSMSGFRLASAGLFAAMGGPWGIALAGVAAGLAIFSSQSGKAKAAQAELDAQVDSVAQTLDQQTAAITANTREMVKKELLDSGAFEKAKKLGIGLDVVTDAALGNADAIAQVNAYGTGLQMTMDAVGGAMTSSGKEVSFAMIQYNALTDAIGIQSGVIDQARQDTLDLAAADGVAAGGSRQLYLATQAQKDAALAGAAAITVQNAKTAAAKTAADQHAAAVRGQITALTQLNSLFLKQQRTMIAFRQTMANSNTVLNDGKRTLNNYTQAGRDNRAALLDIAEAADNVANKAKRTEALKEARRRIVEWATAALGGRDAAVKYADKIFGLRDAAAKLPRNVSMDVKLSGAAAAEADANRLLARLYDLDRFVASPTIAPSSPGSAQDPNRREGGPVWAGQRFHVGEVGPELLLRADGATEVIGKNGPERRYFDQPGYVVPHDRYTAMQAEVARREAPRAEAAAPATGPRGSATATAPAPLQTPEIHNHWHGDAAPTEEQIEAATLRAWRKWQREQEERS